MINLEFADWATAKIIAEVTGMSPLSEERQRIVDGIYNMSNFILGDIHNFLKRWRLYFAKISGVRFPQEDISVEAEVVLAGINLYFTQDISNDFIG